MKQVIIKEQGKSYTLIITHKISDIKAEWNLLSGQHTYAQTDYLELLENNGPKGFGYVYVVVKTVSEVLATYYFQHKTIKLYEDFRIHSHKKDFFSKTRIKVLKQLFKLIKHDILISGNVLLTGEYAYSNSANSLSYIYDRLTESACLYIKEVHNKRIKTILAKDFYIDNEVKHIDFHGAKYAKIEVQPDMVFKVNPEWKDYQDYIGAVRSKYRVKFKKVKKKGNNLNIRKLDESDALTYNDQMYSMYKDTADRATFSLFLLHENYFSTLKKVLGDNLSLFGVFLEERMVGFFTFVKNGDAADAHFLGYDVHLNSKYQLYFNILLKLVEEAILIKAKYLNLSRTALEIKSSVGAEPYRMNVFLKHRNPLLNIILPTLLKYTVPENNWVQRSPYGK